jgi:tetratricopeptide (TPR) repeat protein
MRTADNRRRQSNGAVAALFVLLSLSAVLSSPGLAQTEEDIANLIFVPIQLEDSSDAVPESGLQADERRDLEDSIAEYQDTIAALRQDNASNQEVIGQLGLLGVALQALKRHDEAISVLREALSLAQANSTEQIPLLEQLIPSYLAKNDMSSVDELEDGIYSIYRENFGPDDREMFFATVNLADWNLSAYYRENYGPRGMRIQRSTNPEVVRQTGITGGDANMTAIGNGTIKQLDDSDITDARVRRIAQLYQDYQEALFATGNVQLAALLEIAKRTASIAFITKQEMDFERNANITVPNYAGSRVQAARNSAERLEESYISGRDALEYAVSTIESVQGVPKEAMAMALLDLADWHLAYGRTQPARESYRRATESLLDAGFTAENIDKALVTDIPLQIPVFATHLYTRRSAGLRADQDLNIRGYIDLSFDIDDVGNASDLEITNRSAGTSPRIERLIEVQFRTMRFRPILRNGELVSPGIVNLRYYYAY